MEAAPPSSFHFTSNPFPAMPVHWAQQSLSTRLVLVAGTPGHNLYSCLLAHIKAAFLSCLTETPSVVAAVAASTCGSRQEPDALAKHPSASLTCPRAFPQPARVIDTFCSAGDMTWCRGSSRGISQRRESASFSTLIHCFTSENVLGCWFVELFYVTTRPQHFLKGTTKIHTSFFNSILGFRSLMKSLPWTFFSLKTKGFACLSYRLKMIFCPQDEIKWKCRVLRRFQATSVCILTDEADDNLNFGHTSFHSCGR